MIRLALVRRLIRTVFGAEPMQDTNVSDNLVNSLINDGIGIAIKQNWKDSIQMDGLEYVNDSFVATFKGLTIAKDEDFIYKATMPQLPFALGRNSGVLSLRLKNPSGKVTEPLIPLSTTQWDYYLGLRDLPNKTTFKYENKEIYIRSRIGLTAYTGNLTMVSAGGNDLTDELNIPDDFLAVVDAYVTAKLRGIQAARVDTTNDGLDNV